VVVRESGFRVRGLGGMGGWRLGGLGAWGFEKIGRSA